MARFDKLTAMLFGAAVLGLCGAANGLPDHAIFHAGARAEPRAGGPIPPETRQLLTVVSSDWSSSHAELRRYERQRAGWRAIGPVDPVVVGYAGYGWGAGLHGRGAPKGRPGPSKHEGDGRSPAGVFAIGPAYGYAPAEQEGLQIAYHMTTAADRCIDDSSSVHYNQIVSSDEVSVDWHSAERMRRDDDLYELAIEIGHNRASAGEPAAADGGSCIFLHVWSGPNSRVTGCTALDKGRLREIARWLVPSAAVLVALPRAEYAALQRAWDLPEESFTSRPR